MTVQLAKIVEDTTALTKALEEYRQRICHKDEEISSLRKRLEEEMTASEQHLKRAKDEADEDLERRDSESRRHVLSLREQVMRNEKCVPKFPNNSDYRVPELRGRRETLETGA